MKQLVIVAHNLRSAHNVGSLLRTAEGLGVQIILTGYTPYPLLAADNRLPHLAHKIHNQIHKTALDAESQPIWQRQESITDAISQLKAEGFTVLALEQTAAALPLPELVLPEKLALIVGREVEGVEPEVLAVCDGAVVIPMFGRKESFNVVQAAAMAMYHWRFVDKQ
ncbi:MAG: TrmH family RNA methyltransferase [Patescibacteria group bacterium]|nr:TrmH family RNA methyltransferase [Patescibacteria group bacterium]